MAQKLRSVGISGYSTDVARHALSKLGDTAEHHFSVYAGEQAFSPGGDLIVAWQNTWRHRTTGRRTYSPEETHVKVWSTKTGEEVFSMSERNRFSTSIGFARDSQLMAIVGQKKRSVIETKVHGIAALWRTDQWQKIKEWHVPNRSGPLSLAPDGAILAIAGGLVPTTVWDCRHARKLRTIPSAYTGGPYDHIACALSRRGGVAFTALGSICSLVDLNTRQTVATLPNPPRSEHGERAAIRRAVFSPDGRYLVTGSGVAIRLWDVGAITGREQFRIGDLPIDWTTGKQRARPEPEVSITPLKEAVTLSNPVEVEVRVRNAGRGSLYRLYCRTSCWEPIFDGKPLIFGKIGSRKSMTRILSLRPSNRVKVGKYRVAFVLEEANGNAPAAATTVIDVRKQPVTNADQER